MTAMTRLFVFTFLLAGSPSILAFAQDVSVGGAATFEVVEAPPEGDRMLRLFNGTDLDGWNGDRRLWKVVGGAIRGETTPENKSTGNTF